ncbi:inositol monophosphatase [Candidatus Sumerlaeota bacterium]|nr:inositol monophosphatase [Candidatus Sumerlaeota bacterium]
MASKRELKRVILEAGETGRRVLQRHLGRVTAVAKRIEIDLVTVADKKAERAIVRCIRRAFPDHAILAEESGATEGADSDYRWVIDPLDGTTNFAHTVPIFSTTLAVQFRGETLMGLVVDVTRDEWFFAQRGGGAFLNGRRIHVSSQRKLAQSVLATGFPHSRRRNVDHFMKMVGEFLMRSHGVLRLGAASIDLAWVACGRMEGFWEEHLQPWDVAAGILLVEEAGGRSTNFKGRRSSIFDSDFAASNGSIHRELLRTIESSWTEW